MSGRLELIALRGFKLTGSELKPLQLLQAAVIARRFYVEGRAKSQIAEEFHLSRFRVARILERARDSGLVRVEIALPARLDADVSARLQAVYGLHHAIVVAAPEKAEEPLAWQLGRVAAALLSEIIDEGDILGIGCGRTLNAMAAALERLPRTTIVQLTGVVGTVHLEEDSVETVRRFAAASGGPSYPIYAPLVVDSEEAVASLRRQQHVALAMEQFDGLTKAVVAIGSWDPPNSQLRESLTAEEIEDLRLLGVRAEVCATFVDDNGQVVATDLVQRCISIRENQLRRIPEVVAVAGGPDKVTALRAILAAGLITSLVTDIECARELLATPARSSDRVTAALTPARD